MSNGNRNNGYSSIAKVALVTGASSGCGAASAVDLVSHGFTRLALAARRTDMLEKTAEACYAAGAEDVLIIKADLMDLQVCQKIVEDTVAKFGRNEANT